MPAASKKHRSSRAWIQRHVTDPFVKSAAAQGYRARSAFKLSEIDDKDHLLRPGMTVIELGAAPGSWTQVILLTDGRATGTDPRLEAEDLYTQDHSSAFAGTQNVIVHVVAFALPQADKDAGAIQELREVATRGGGSFYQAENAAELEKALQAAISRILAATFSFATPVVPTTGTAGTTRAYLASFQSNPSRPFWRGYLKAYNRDSNGLIPVDANSVPLSSAMAWDAGQQLSVKTASSRTIYTVISGTRHNFTTTNTSLTAALVNASSDTEKDKIINFTRGIDSYDEDSDLDTSEARQWKLGDIFHSTPVLVQPPFLVSSDSTYTTFKTYSLYRSA